MFLLPFNIILSLPLMDREIQDFFPFDPFVTQVNAVTSSRNASLYDVRYSDHNTSVQLSSEPAHVRQKRDVNYCVSSKATEKCGDDLIVTVKCKKRSAACIFGGNGPSCVEIKTYYAACAKLYTTDCSCS